ncbi:MAG TPA: TlpA disulfide reductase family protein [Chitinophagaceae bacterium]|nr:TlpA disulfide reductase family protein [Chitinophagaceae bacterium]
MQKIVIAILVVSFVSACSSGDSSFTVSGTLKNTASKLVYVEETNTTNGENIRTDSATIDDSGKFSVKVKAKDEGIYNLRLKDDIAHFVTVINDASSIKINADFNKRFNFYNVEGSKASKAIQEYLARLNEMQREKFNYLVQIDSIKKGQGDSLLAEDLNKKQREISNRLKLYTKQTVEQSDNSSLAFHILSTYVVMARDPNYRMKNFTAAELLAILNDMVRKFPDRTDIAGIRNSIESQTPKTMWVGRPAPEISMPDTGGKTVSLSSFRGKYVLVDFWASWCAPCRRENPNVVEAYNRFKNKNFTILGVSLDRPGEKERWMQAIRDDNLTWTHVSDLKYWQSAAVSIYQFQSIPFNVLVDPQGNVIAENLREGALEEKLEEVLN